MKHLRLRKKAGALLLAVGALVALTMFVVLPALASNVNDQVPPASGIGNVLPVDIGVGGNQSCSSEGLFPGMTGVQQTTDPSPSTGTYPSGHGWNFTLTLGALPGYAANKGQSLAIDSNGHAAIVGIAIKGGTDNLSYDYRPTAQGWVSADTKLHAPASKFTAGTNPETGITQYYGVSQIVICYKTPLATISGNAYKDISGKPGIGGLTVTLKDTTAGAGGTQTTTTSSTTGSVGNYSFQGVAGDNYTVCISNPSFTNVQTFPTDDTGSCTGTTGTKGYSITGLSSTGVSGEDFGFQPLSSVGGRVYNDLSNPANAKYDAATDAPQSGWTLTLYKNTAISGPPTWQQVAQQTSDANGLYNFANALTPGGDYRVCESQPAVDLTLWAQSQPIPGATSQCGSPLQYGYRFTAPSTNITSDDFGNLAGGIQCPPQPIGGDATNGELQIKLAACKPTQIFIFDTATPDDPNYPWVSVFAGDQTQPKQPLIEKIVFPDPIVDGVPTLQHIAYTDVFPYDPSAAVQMPYCKLDPRDPSDLSGMTLASGFLDDSTKSQVLPNDIGTDTQATSCAISIRTYVDANGDGWLEAFAYSDIDGLTKGTG